MMQTNDFSPFDPLTMRQNMLPAKSGNYLMVLRTTESLPQNVSINITPQFTSIEYNGDYYAVVYVEKSKKSIKESYKQHFQGTADNSTIRKSIGCLIGFKLKSDNMYSDSLSSKKGFNDMEEQLVTEWMKKNLLVLYYTNNDYKNAGQELIKVYNPPLNLQGNFYKVNAEYRKQLSALRTGANLSNPAVVPEMAQPSHTNCPNCNLNLTVPDGLKKEKYIKCLSCGYVFENPFYVQKEKSKEGLQWKILLILVGIVLVFSFVPRHGKDPSKSNDRKIENYVNRKGPSQTEAMAGVRVYLKRYYLKDPDSYQGISWEAFGIYNQENNTYFALHKYRAKNSFGGYVVEEKLFVLDSNGNVIKVVDDVNEIINGY